MTRGKPGSSAAPRVEDTALDALAAALAPRVARLLREQAANEGDDALAELLARAGFELDSSQDSQ